MKKLLKFIVGVAWLLTIACSMLIQVLEEGSSY